MIIEQGKLNELKTGNKEILQVLDWGVPDTQIIFIKEITENE